MCALARASERQGCNRRSVRRRLPVVHALRRPHMIAVPCQGLRGYWLEQDGIALYVCVYGWNTAVIVCVCVSAWIAVLACCRVFVLAMCAYFRGAFSQAEAIFAAPKGIPRPTFAQGLGYTVTAAARSGGVVAGSVCAYCLRCSGARCNARPGGDVCAFPALYCRPVRGYGGLAP